MDQQIGHERQFGERSAGHNNADARVALDPDEKWVRQNLRIHNGTPILDIANALRVFDRHPDFQGRFRYNDTLNKVLDKGTVMLDWRVFEVVAVLQERFLPGISENDVRKALIVHSNRKDRPS